MADLKNTFSKGITVLNVKTANFLELNKIKTYIATLNADITALKSEVGSLVYENWKKNGAVELETIEEKLLLIREKEHQIQAQEEAAARLTEEEKQILGEQENKGQASVPASDVSLTEPVYTCPSCGQTYEQVYKFCRKCGTRLN